jgi:pyrimidine deaminase RibD-like protein
VIGMGVNKYTNQPFLVSPEHMDKCSVHAEVAAIRSAGGRVNGATVYVARINKRGEARYSQPCENCQYQLDSHGVRKVVWT